MSEQSINFWRDLDAQLLKEEAQIAKQQAFLSQDTADAMDEWDAHVQSLPVDEAITALRGLETYKQEIADEV